MNERNAMINFLLTACDQKDSLIADLQKQLADKAPKAPKQTKE